MTPDDITRAAILLARRQELYRERRLIRETCHPMTNVKLNRTDVSSSHENIGKSVSLPFEVSYSGYMSFLDQEISSIELELEHLGVALE